VVDRYWVRRFFLSLQRNLPDSKPGKQEIELFVPEEFWSIECKLTRAGAANPVNVNFQWARDRLFDHFCALVIYERLCRNPTATVQSVRGRPTRKWRPFPLTTVELQKLASRKLKISSQRVMQIAEKIYQKGFISYPRTETDQFPDNLDYAELIGEQAVGHGAPWGAYAATLLGGPGQLSAKFVTPKRGRNNDQSHPPIHPTKAAFHALHGDDLRVYELITRHFLACCRCVTRLRSKFLYV
jgi:DNA topoisomerase III